MCSAGAMPYDLYYAKMMRGARAYGYPRHAHSRGGADAGSSRNKTQCDGWKVGSHYCKFAMSNPTREDYCRSHEVSCNNRPIRLRIVAAATDAAGQRDELGE